MTAKLWSRVGSGAFRLAWQRLPVLLLLLPALAGCVSQGANRNFVHPEMMLGKKRHIAILPFENLSNNPTAGLTISQLLATELFARNLFDIMEESEMRRLLIKNKVDMDRLADVSIARKLARKLGVDAVLTGSISEFSYQHGLREEPAVGFNLRLIRTQDGAVLWRASQSNMGSGFLSRESIITTAQKAVRQVASGAYAQPNPGWRTRRASVKPALLDEASKNTPLEEKSKQVPFGALKTEPVGNDAPKKGTMPNAPSSSVAPGDLSPAAIRDVLLQDAVQDAVQDGPPQEADTNASPQDATRDTTH